MSKSTKCWSLVKSNGVCPTARSGHSAVVAKESLYIFGGCGHPAVKCASRSPTLSSIPDGELDREAMPVCLGDLHVYDLARQSWSEVIPKDLSVVPAERTCAAMCTSEEEDRLFLSGGAGDNPNDLRADLLEFDVRQCTWRLLFDGSGSTSYSACRRIGHAMVHDSARNRLIVFGGSTGFEYFDDTHAFDLATGRWCALVTTGERPTPRYKHQTFVDSDAMYVVGGGSFEPEGPDLDVFRLHLGGPKALQWERMRPTGKPPRCRAAHGLAWDKVGRAAYIWGGFTSGMELDSTFCALRLPAAPAVRHPREVQEHQRLSSPPTREAALQPGAISTLGTDVFDSRAQSGATSHDRASIRTSSVASGNNMSSYSRQATAAVAGGPRVKPRRGASASPRIEEVTSIYPSNHVGGGQHPYRGIMHGIDAPVDNTNGFRNHERERRSHRGQRLWRQSGDGCNHGRRRRSRGGSRRRPWGQGWAAGRLQGLWGGAGQAPCPSSLPTMQRLPLERSAAAPRGSRSGVRDLLHPPSTSVQAPHESKFSPDVREELAWVSLPNRSDSGDADVTPAPAGRSFHCAFFHSGACYVTGGSDGDRKFGDMWRFSARETPPPLTTLAARVVVLATKGKKEAGIDPGGGEVSTRDTLLRNLPEELCVALANLNMQAEVVV